MRIYIDGEMYDKDEAKISVFDHGLLYGDGIFEGLRVYAGKVFKLAEHVERLYASAKALMLEIPMGPSDMEALVLRCVAENGKRDGYIRLIVTRGVGDLGVNPFLCPKPSVIVIVGDISLYPKDYYEKGIKLVTSSLRRIGPSSFDVRVKSLNYLNNVLAKIEAVRAGCLEALMLNESGHIAECTADNVFIVSKGRLLTPECVEGALRGITRGAVLECAKRLGIEFAETRLGQYDVYNADECFITGTGAELMPVIELDSRRIGSGLPGPVTGRIRKAFAEMVLE
jgi:branched-chain amino acid aminotransferase